MKKLINGIIEFRKNLRPEEREKFAELALGQFPDALLITCSDSRVAPNVFASTNPGDVFVVRNVGNMVAACDHFHGRSIGDESEFAALEFAITKLNVLDIIICGHSECGAMQALLKGRESVDMPHLKTWLRHGDPALETLRAEDNQDKTLAPHNRLSQLNVLQQIEHLKTYPLVQEKLAKKEIRLHGWWFNLAEASVHWYLPSLDKFVEIDEKNGEMLLEEFKNA